MAEPPSIWLRGRIGGSSGADAARYLLRPPLIQPVELNTQVAGMARERGWNPCKLSSDQRLALVKEVLDSLPKPVPPEPAQPKRPTPSEQHAQELLEQVHAAAGGTGEYSDGTPGIGGQGLIIRGADGDGDHGAVEDQRDGRDGCKAIDDTKGDSKMTVILTTSDSKTRSLNQAPAVRSSFG